ncbi:hypothetical protein ABH970_006002 [Bradyrhizobium ottawaense]
MKTIERAEVMCWSASAVSSGKPTTTPMATMVREAKSPRCGRACRSTPSTATPISAAMTARADVRNSAEKPPTATRVAGSEPLKMMTPSRPLPQPLPADCMSVPPFPSRDTRLPAVARPVTIQYNPANLYGYGR